MGRVSSVEQDHGAGELDAGEEICGEFVIAGGDGTKVLEFVEEALDEVALAIEHEITTARTLRLALGGITGAMSRRSSASMKGSASKALSPSTAPGSTDSSSGSAQVRSCACPGVSITSTGLPSASTRAWILVVSPPRERPIACSPFFFVRRRCAGERARWWRRSSCIRYHGRSPAA